MVQISDFQISAYLHPASTRKRPIWYGTVDGYTVTCPWSDKDRAIESAKATLESGDCLAGFLDSINCYKGWLKEPLSEETKTKAITEIPKIQEKLYKIANYLLNKKEIERDSLVMKWAVEIVNGKYDYKGETNADDTN